MVGLPNAWSTVAKKRRSNFWRLAEPTPSTLMGGSFDWRQKPTAFGSPISSTPTSRLARRRLKRCLTRSPPSMGRCCRVSRCGFCWQVALAWFATYGFDTRASGELITLANAKNVPLDALFAADVFRDLHGRACLMPRGELPAGWD